MIIYSTLSSPMVLVLPNNKNMLLIESLSGHPIFQCFCFFFFSGTQEKRKSLDCDSSNASQSRADTLKVKKKKHL